MTSRSSDVIPRDSAGPCIAIVAIAETFPVRFPFRDQIINATTAIRMRFDISRCPFV